MKFSNDIQKQLNNLFAEQPMLKVVEKTDEIVTVEGQISVHGQVKQFVVNNKYDIRIIIPVDLGFQLPMVYETKDKIDKEYEHKYSDGGLCLETLGVIRLRFIDGFDLTKWFDEFVKPYFITYEYYKRFGVYPFGDRRHGANGIIDAYKEILHAEDDELTKKLMLHIAVNEYRGHSDCPCGSGNLLRKCHGKHMLPFYKNQEMKLILEHDLYEVLKEDEEFSKRMGRYARA